MAKRQHALLFIFVRAQHQYPFCLDERRGEAISGITVSFAHRIVGCLMLALSGRAVVRAFGFPRGAEACQDIVMVEDGRGILSYYFQ